MKMQEVTAIQELRHNVMRLNVKYKGVGGKFTLNKLRGEKFHRGARFEWNFDRPERIGGENRQGHSAESKYNVSFGNHVAPLDCTRDVVTDDLFLSLIGAFSIVSF